MQLKDESDFEANKKFLAIMNREESIKDIEVPIEQFSDEQIEFQKNVLLLSVINTWKLVNKNRTPDTSAIKKLLDVRYRHSLDDIAHENFWGNL